MLGDSGDGAAVLLQRTYRNTIHLHSGSAPPGLGRSAVAHSTTERIFTQLWYNYTPRLHTPANLKNVLDIENYGHRLTTRSFRD